VSATVAGVIAHRIDRIDRFRLDRDTGRETHHADVDLAGLGALAAFRQEM
jgi:hypothetical protein